MEEGRKGNIAAVDNFLEEFLFKREGRNDTFGSGVSRIRKVIVSQNVSQNMFFFNFSKMFFKNGSNISMLFVFEWK